MNACLTKVVLVSEHRIPWFEEGWCLFEDGEDLFRDVFFVYDDVEDVFIEP